MKEERIERLLELLLAAEVRNLAVRIRSRAAHAASDDSINRRPIEHYLPSALERLEPVISYLRGSALRQQRQHD